MHAVRQRPALLVAALLTACGAGPVPVTEEPTRPERLVLVVGESADALGIEQARDPRRDAALVALHDGTRTWVESWRVRDLELVPGSRVVVRRGGELAVATLVERVDRMAWVGVADVPSLVSISDVVAVLRRSDVTAGPPIVPPGPETPPAPAPPPVDPARVVTFDGASLWAVGRLTACADGAATIALPEGRAPLVVPFDRVAPLALEAGDRVWAPWEGSSYPATILETRSGMVHLRWDDESDVWMPAEDLRRVLREPPSSARARRPSACLRSAAPVLVHLGRLRLAGVVQGCTEGRALVLRPDGSRDERPLAELARARIEVGDTIEASWHGGGVYSATVIAIDGGTLRVRWEDASEEDVALDTLVSVLEPAGAEREHPAPACP